MSTETETRKKKYETMQDRIDAAQAAIDRESAKTSITLRQTGRIRLYECRQGDDCHGWFNIFETDTSILMHGDFGVIVIQGGYYNLSWYPGMRNIDYTIEKISRDIVQEKDPLPESVRGCVAACADRVRAHPELREEFLEWAGELRRADYYVESRDTIAFMDEMSKFDPDWWEHDPTYWTTRFIFRVGILGWAAEQIRAGNFETKLESPDA